MLERANQDETSFVGLVRERGIRAAARGSGADSLVCYALGVPLGKGHLGCKPALGPHPGRGTRGSLRSPTR